MTQAIKQAILTAARSAGRKLLVQKNRTKFAVTAALMTCMAAQADVTYVKHLTSVADIVSTPSLLNNTPGSLYLTDEQAGTCALSRGYVAYVRGATGRTIFGCWTNYNGMVQWWDQHGASAMLYPTDFTKVELHK
ncbi:hypothetical protein WKW80_05780 [Variovorax humicola]|uniref:Uncharacterized protein n=1 Tax=Variovorax humicola TaxID=1769758 RepID=A0ABU8VUQ5_9BURK